VLGVHEAAYVALVGILDFAPFQAGSTGDDLSSRPDEARRALAAQLRSFAEKWQNATREERWFGRLLDDRSGPQGWGEAAQTITQNANESRIPGSMAFGQTQVVTALPPGTRRTARGEVLRAKSKPSVAELLEKRSADARGTDARASCQLLLSLAEWEPTAPATLRALGDLMGTANGAPDAGSQLDARCVLGISRARLLGGDAQALQDYAQWLMMPARAQAVTADIPQVLGFLAMRPSDPHLTKAAEFVFGPRSPWLPLVATKPNVYSPLSIFVGYVLGDRALLRVPAFRQMLLRELENDTVVASIQFEEEGYRLVGIGGWGSGGRIRDEDRPKAMKAPMQVRMADYVADLVLGQGEPVTGAPRFHIYWPKAKRDAALPTIRAWLQQISP